MTALELLQAEMEIVCAEARRMPWTLDPAPWERGPGSHAMTPAIMRMQLLALVDEYAYDGSLSPGEQKVVRDAIEAVMARVRDELEARLGGRCGCRK